MSGNTDDMSLTEKKKPPSGDTFKGFILIINY